MSIAAGEVRGSLEGQTDGHKSRRETNGQADDHKNRRETNDHAAPTSRTLSSFIKEKARDKGKLYFLCYVIAKNLFSTFGTVFLVLAYGAFGGWLFEMLEDEKDLPSQSSLDIIDIETRVEQLWQLTQELKNKTTNDIDKDTWENGTFKFLDNFREAVYNITKSTAWNGESKVLCTKDIREDMECPSDYQTTGWNFLGAVFFAMSLITTIGYGNIAPVTEVGRIVSMAYATLGIPITLLCLAMVGRMFAQLYRFLFQKLLHGFFKKVKECLCGKKKRPTAKTTNGVDPGKTNDIPNMNNSSGEPGPPEPEDQGKAGNQVVAKQDAERRDSQDEYDEEDAPLRVPLTITTLTIIFYVYIGSIMFAEWKKEQGWDFIISSYFCFITLSTIGLGDYTFDASTNPEQIPVAGIYILAGLSLLSMCFDLLAVEMEGKFVDISIIAGISNDICDEDYSTDESEEEGDKKKHNTNPDPNPGEVDAFEQLQL